MHEVWTKYSRSREVLKQGVEAATPVVRQGIKTVGPVLIQGVETAAPVVRKGIDLDTTIAGIIEPGTRLLGVREALSSDGKTRRVQVKTEEVSGWVSLRVLEVDREAVQAKAKMDREDKATREKRYRQERDARELGRFVQGVGQLSSSELTLATLAGPLTFRSAEHLLCFWFGKQFYHSVAAPFTVNADYVEHRMPLWFGGASRLFDAAQLNAEPLIQKARHARVPGFVSRALDGRGRDSGTRPPAPGGAPLGDDLGNDETEHSYH